MDHSNGYEQSAAEFITARDRGIGVRHVQAWARMLPKAASVIDIGCGPGIPMTAALVAEGLEVYGIDAAPTFVREFQRNLPNTPIACEPVQGSRFFDRMFDAALAWGLIFLLSPDDQRRLLQRFSEILVPGGHLLFTAPAPRHVWKDVMTQQESQSLGAEEYRRLLTKAGFAFITEYEDEGENHYYDAVRA